MMFLLICIPVPLFFDTARAIDTQSDAVGPAQQMAPWKFILKGP